MNLADKILGMIPDGMLTKVLQLIVQKLIGNLPDDQKQIAWDKFLELCKVIVAAGAEGATKGAIDGAQGKG